MFHHHHNICSFSRIFSLSFAQLRQLLVELNCIELKPVKPVELQEKENWFLVTFLSLLTLKKLIILSGLNLSAKPETAELEIL